MQAEGTRRIDVTPTDNNAPGRDPSTLDGIEMAGDVGGGDAARTATDVLWRQNVKTDHIKTIEKTNLASQEVDVAICGDDGA